MFCVDEYKDCKLCRFLKMKKTIQKLEKILKFKCNGCLRSVYGDTCNCHD